MSDKIQATKTASDEASLQFLPLKLKQSAEEIKSIFMLLADESEFAKWNKIVIRPLEQIRPEGFFVFAELQEMKVDRRVSLWSLKTNILSFKALEDYIHNSQYLLNPAESDKIGLHERIYVESSDFSELFHKHLAK